MKRTLLRAGAALFGALVLIAVFFIVMGWSAFGHRATGARRERMEKSKQWAGGHFENAQPMFNDVWGSLTAFNDISPVSTPKPGEVPVISGGAERFATPPDSGLRITWFGHSTTLIELDGIKLLTDPVFSERASPYTFVGPARWYAPLIPLEALSFDAVMISHDHYDHLDEQTIRQLAKRDVRFFVPLGIGAHLEYWGVPPANITELDWWEEGELKGVRIVSTPSRHASGRWATDQGGTLWTSWSVVGPQHRVYYSGDTGLLPAMNDIGEKLGPFDVAMVEIGQYHRAWPDWHIGPEQAVRAAGMVKAKLLFPIHWCLFTLAMHGWTEPIQRVVLEAEKRAQPLVTPKPGQSVEPSAPPPNEKWWPADVPWQTAAEHPIVSTKVPPG